MEKGTRMRLISAGVLLLVLATGFILGLAWDRRPGGLLAGDAAERVRAPEGRRGKSDLRRDRNLIVERVGLSPEQEESVDSIVELHRQALKEIQREFRSEYGPRHRALVQETRDAIRSVLTPDQRIRYDSLLARHDRKKAGKRHEEPDADEARGPS